MTKPNKIQVSNKTDADITIVGGGMVGMAMAIGLAQHGFQVALLEANDLQKESSEADERSLVCNLASVKFWQSIGCWGLIRPIALPIKKVRVLAKKHFGIVRFNANELGVNHLGYVIPAHKLVSILLTQVKSSEHINYLCPAHYCQHESDMETVCVSYKNHQGKLLKVTSNLLAAADGARSRIRQAIGLKPQVKSYRKVAVVCQVSIEKDHEFTAYEYLTAEGPIALLPISSYRCGLVWSVDEGEANELIGLGDVGFIYRLQSQFGYRLGVLSDPSPRVSYPLYQITNNRQYDSRVLLMGNAAHTVSPVSAQGLNLALRDIQRFLTLIGFDSGTVKYDELLQQYQLLSQPDQQQTIQYSDDLMSWFQPGQQGLTQLRSLGMLVLDNIPYLKKTIFKRVGGFR